MNKDVRNYTWSLDIRRYEQYCYYTNVFTDVQIEEIKKLGDTLEGKDASIESAGIEKNTAGVNKEVRNSIISFMPITEENEWLFRSLTDIISTANKAYFGFDLNSIETLQYTVYNEGGFYDKHIDILNSTSSSGVRKLSFSLQLTDEEEYEGGDLIISNAKDVAISRNKGTITFFPSYTPHEVLPVTSGVRKALVGWIIGPNFK